MTTIVLLGLPLMLPANPPPAPPGFTFAAGSCIGDSSTTAIACLARGPGRIGSGACTADTCFTLASAACLVDDTCNAFAFDAPSLMYETFSAGLANVVANNAWVTYAKPAVCCECPDDGSSMKATAKKVQSFHTGWYTSDRMAPLLPWACS